MQATKLSDFLSKCREEETLPLSKETPDEPKSPPPASKSEAPLIIRKSHDQNKEKVPILKITQGSGENPVDAGNTKVPGLKSSFIPRTVKVSLSFRYASKGF